MRSAMAYPFHGFYRPGTWLPGKRRSVCAGAVDRAVATAVTGGHPCVKWFSEPPLLADTSSANIATGPYACGA